MLIKLDDAIAAVEDYPATLEFNGMVFINKDAMLAALRSLPTDDGWEDIATAPRDGTPFLGFDSNKGTFAVCEMVNVSTKLPLFVGRPVSWDWDDYIPKPTHWRPLPTPPSE